MAKAIKLKSGNWRCQAYVGKDENGKRIIKSFTASTKKEAEYMAADYTVNRKEKAKSGMTVGEAIDKYIEYKSNILSPTTIQGYKRIRKNNLQQLMNIYVEELTQQTVQQAVNEESLRLSSKSIKHAHGLLTAALNVYQPNMRLNTTLPKIQKKYKDLPQPQEIMQAVAETEIELPVLCGLWLGMRMSEICGMRRMDITGNVLTIQNTKVYVNGQQIEKSQTKTAESTRRIILPQKILDLIAEIETATDDECLIKLSGSAIYKRFMKIIKKNNLKKMTFHDLRHINASVMMMLNIPEKYAMERGGWSSPSIMKSVYQHTYSDEKKKIDNQINNYFEQIINT